MRVLEKHLGGRRQPNGPTGSPQHGSRRCLVTLPRLSSKLEPSMGVRERLVHAAVPLVAYEQLTSTSNFQVILSPQ